MPFKVSFQSEVIPAHTMHRPRTIWGNCRVLMELDEDGTPKA
ncbi:hypothetical protein [Paenibacillus sp. Marseille-P2973]|nr:hypothetical protein [Paenibacillus sp. Marseille-P2973]